MGTLQNNPVLRHLVNVAAASLVGGAIAFADAHHAQLMSLIPYQYQAFAVTVGSIIAALYAKSSWGGGGSGPATPAA